MTDAKYESPQERGFKPQALGLSTAALVLLRDLIEQHTGQFFDDQKLDLLADKITDLVAANGSPSLLDYYYLLKYDDSTDTHWLRLLDRLAVPETYFWRQAEQIDALITHVVPRFMQQHPGARLKIWSAACCSGEEPLSIAMALDRAGLFDRLDIDIVATDGSEAMLARAKRNVFGERSMRSLPENLLHRYFQPATRGWSIDPTLHSRIRWGRANLADTHEIARYADADVVYCRNVLIYFSENAIRNVAASFVRHMPTHGVLFLGASESLLRLSTEFRMIEIGSAFAYTPITNGDHEYDAMSSFHGLPESSTRSTARTRV